MTEKEKDGVKIEFLSKSTLQDMTFDEKLDMIMDEVQEGNIIVMEEALNPEEKKKLIQTSMETADEDFPGIEFSGFDPETGWVQRILKAVTGNDPRDGLLIVGSSRVMEKMEEGRDEISLMAKLE